MKETLILVADPEIPRTVRGAGKHNSARPGDYGNKPIILKEGNSAIREDPDSPAIVLREGLKVRPGAGARGLCPWQRVTPDLAVFQSGQTIGAANPDTSIL